MIEKSPLCIYGVKSVLGNFKLIMQLIFCHFLNDPKCKASFHSRSEIETNFEISEDLAEVQ